MELWIDNEKAWRLSKQMSAQGMADNAIAKALYKEHGLVSMRTKKAYSPGAIFAIRTNGKPKRLMCKFVGEKPGRRKAVESKPAPDAEAGDVNQEIAVVVLGLAQFPIEARVAAAGRILG